MKPKAKEPDNEPTLRLIHRVVLVAVVTIAVVAAAAILVAIPFVGVRVK